MEQDCGPSASPLPLHSTYQEESGTHSPTLLLLFPQGPDSYLKNCLLRPPATPGGSPLNSSLSLCCSGKSFQTEVNIMWLLSQTGVSPYLWHGCLPGQGSEQGRTGPGQASRTERTSLFLVFFLLPFSFALLWEFLPFLYFLQSQDVCGPDVVARLRKESHLHSSINYIKTAHS